MVDDPDPINSITALYDAVATYIRETLELRETLVEAEWRSLWAKRRLWFRLSARILTPLIMPLLLRRIVTGTSFRESPEGLARLARHGTDEARRRPQFEVVAGAEYFAEGLAESCRERFSLTPAVIAGLVKIHEMREARWTNTRWTSLPWLIFIWMRVCQGAGVGVVRVGC